MAKKKGEKYFYQVRIAKPTVQRVGEKAEGKKIVSCKEVLCSQEG